MKKNLATTFLLLFTQFCFAQDFWMQLDVPEDTGVYCVKGNSTGETFLGARGLHKSIDHGLNWLPTDFTELTGTIDINLRNGDILVGNHLGVFYSIDNGETWHATTFHDNANIIYISTYNNVFVGTWGEIYKSSDFGETWIQTLQLDNTQVINSIVENTDGVLFAGITSYFGGGGVYSSFNNGDSWQQAGLNNKFISSLAISSTGVLFAGSRGDYEYGGGGVFRSEDNGITWEEVAFNVWVTSMVIDPNDVLYIGCTREHGGPGGVYRTIDNGDSWDHIITGMSDYHRTVEGLSLSPDGYLYAYSRWVLYRSTQPVFSSNSIIQQETIDLNIYPNPFTDILHIELSNKHPLQGSLSVRVIDLLGRVVYSNRLSNPKGFEVNLSTLPPGFYYISIEVNRQKYSKPIIKVLR